MEAFWDSILPLLKEFAPLIVALAALGGALWRIPTKGDLARAYNGWSGRMDKLDSKIDDTRSELRAEIKAVEAKVDKTNENYLEFRGDVKALSRDVAALTDKVSRIERDIEAARSASP